MTKEISTRERILAAAAQIAAKNGIKALTQPRVAKAAGVTQSLLTYYFPRKADLLTAVLEASHQPGPIASPRGVDEALKFLEALMFDPTRMRFFLGAVVEAGEENALRKVLGDHASALTRQIAGIFNRDDQDPAILAFIDRLRGLGIQVAARAQTQGRREDRFESNGAGAWADLIGLPEPGSSSFRCRISSLIGTELAKSYGKREILADSMETA
ncbi:MAG: TetR family transcriptional regulator [Methylocystis sp.]|uniref:TetR family transcriptional regulator n=1 Tax=Methylocystis sp. TaxID=1911079 RepID=UPI003DA33551